MILVPQAEDVLVQRALLAEDMIVVLAPVAAEHHTQGVGNGLLEEGVADQGDQVGVELLDVPSFTRLIKLFIFSNIPGSVFP